MFTESLIVSTAVSSFNNAALYNPMFLALGILCLPLFFMVYLYGRDAVSKIGWNNHNFENQTFLFSSLFLALWIMMFGGNYAVIRDSISLLPLLVSFGLFGLFVVVSQKIVMLKYNEKISNKKLELVIFFVLMLMAVGSSMMNWYSILLQCAAVLTGIIVGCRVKKNISLVSFGMVLYGYILTLILMQPEYFRFGQLGNLTLVHLLSVVFVGVCAVTALVVKYTKPRAKIHDSAYIKLKWLFRILSILALVLFVVTESVPVFLSLLITCGLSEMLTIIHRKSFNSELAKHACALMIFGLGIIIICPVISALGILYLTFVSQKIKLREFRDLL